MFEAAETGRSVSKEDFDREVPGLRQELLAAQAALRRADFPVIIVVGGVDGAGKGETVNTLLEWLDPRYVETFALGPATDEERERPPYWRFWRALPPRGKIGIFFGGWHSAPIVERAYRNIKEPELDRQLAEVVAFERLLTADGAVLLKFWMHLAKDRQRKRLRSLEKDPRTRWRVTELDWQHFAIYHRFAKVSAHALRRTSTVEAPWMVIEATDRRYQTLTVGRALRDALVAQLAVRGAANRPAPVEIGPAASAASPPRVTILSGLDLTQTVTEDGYHERLEEAWLRSRRSLQPIVCTSRDPAPAESRTCAARRMAPTVLVGPGRAADGARPGHRQAGDDTSGASGGCAAMLLLVGTLALAVRRRRGR